MRIGEVAERAGCNIQTLRYYERRGLLSPPARTRAGYRDYPSDTPRVIRFIKRAQDLGFTLQEVEELLKLRRGQTRHRGEVRSLAETKMRDVEDKIARLEAIRRALGGLVESCACEDKSPDCPILGALDEPNGQNPANPVRKTA